MHGVALDGGFDEEKDGKWSSGEGRRVGGGGSRSGGGTKEWFGEEEH